MIKEIKWLRYIVFILLVAFLSLSIDGSLWAKNDSGSSTTKEEKKAEKEAKKEVKEAEKEAKHEEIVLWWLFVHSEDFDLKTNGMFWAWLLMFGQSDDSTSDGSTTDSTSSWDGEVTTQTFN